MSQLIDNQKESFTGSELDRSGQFTHVSMDATFNLLPPGVLIKDLEISTGVSRKTLRKYQAEGIDITDVAAVKARHGALNGADASAVRLANLKEDNRKKKLENEIKELDLAQKRGALVSLAEICESNTAIAAKVKAQINTLALTLPPICEGLTAREMKARIETAADDILTFLWGEFGIDDE